MKINKLYTLSQFINHVRNLAIADKEVSSIVSVSMKFNLICKYNDFLEQITKREMIINDITHPNFIKGHRTSEQYNIQHKEWREAEDKILFIEPEIGEWGDGLDVFIALHSTLAILAHISKGELTLKNVEL